MKVALLLQFYFPFGGLQRDCVAMAQGLAERGMQVTIVTRSWEGEQPMGIEVIELGARGVSNVAMDQNFDRDVRAWLATKDFSAVVGFSRLETDMDFYYAADPCYRLRIERDRSIWYQFTRKCRYFKSLEKKLFGMGGHTQLLLITEMEVPDYQAFYGTELERITILPPSIRKRDLTMKGKEALRKEVRKRMHWPDELPVVLFVGSGFATKGLDRAISACAAIQSDLKFCVVGDGKTGEYKTQVKRVAAEDCIDFLGGRDDAWELMAGADLMIHPARSENTGTVLVEALSAGTGVLTTDRCGFSNHISASGAGRVLSSPFDQNALNETLENLLAEPWQERAESALQYAAEEDLYSGMQTAVSKVMSLATQCAS